MTDNPSSSHESRYNALASFIYNLLLIIFSPIIALAFLWRVFINRKSRDSWRENLGGLPRLSTRPKGRKLVWVHNVSVGETIASLPVRKEIRRLMPDAEILVTTITRTGNEVARNSAACGDAVAYFPLDYPAFVNRALHRIKPDVFVMVEAELWPNFLTVVKRRGIPTLLINGLVSDRTMRRCKQWGWLMRWAVSNLDYCCMQTESDAKRMISLGVDPKKVSVLGNTKMDQEGGKLSPDAVNTLRSDLCLSNGVPVFIAGSTNLGEDEPVVDAFMTMRESVRNLKLIIAPRQLVRVGEIEGLVSSRKLKCAKRSEKPSNDYDVLILDTLGELASVYAVADITFVGGTLIRKGGHSLIQPVLQGKPVLFGPHTFKTRDMAKMVLDAGVGFEVKDSRELAETGCRLLNDLSTRKDIATSCERLVSTSQGASTRCAELIVSLLQGGRDAA